MLYMIEQDTSQQSICDIETVNVGQCRVYGSGLFVCVSASAVSYAFRFIRLCLPLFLHMTAPSRGPVQSLERPQLRKSFFNRST